MIEKRGWKCNRWGKLAAIKGAGERAVDKSVVKDSIAEAMLDPASVQTESVTIQTDILIQHENPEQGVPFQKNPWSTGIQT